MKRISPDIFYMLTIDELNLKLLSELKEIAGSLGVPDYAKLPKKEIVNRILVQQEVSKPVAEVETATSDEDEPKKKRARRTIPNEVPVAGTKPLANRPAKPRKDNATPFATSAPLFDNPVREERSTETTARPSREGIPARHDKPARNVDTTQIAEQGDDIISDLGKEETIEASTSEEVSTVQETPQVESGALTEKENNTEKRDY